MPSKELKWFSFSWSVLRKKENENPQENITIVEAWYTLQVPVAQGSAEFWGLPGLILEVSAGNTTLLCTELVLNPNETIKIKALQKGSQTTKTKYSSIIHDKMIEMKNNRMNRKRGR